MHELIELVEKFDSPHVVLVGDFILDRYVYGDVERINPEAPVPVMRTVRSQNRVGGAGNVAAAVPALDGRVSCIGVIGKDAGGKELNRLLTDAGAKTSSLLRLDDRATSVKTRYVGLAQHCNAQQMLRVDEEATKPLAEDVRAMLAAAVRTELDKADIVVLEDYDKGIFDRQFTSQIIADAEQAGAPVVVDPACIAEYSKYRGATLIKPNRYEAALASGIEITDDESLERAARQIQIVTDARAVVISLDRQGMYLFTHDGQGRRIAHPRPRSVYDVTGAGDETLAVLAVALTQGCSNEQAVELANIAGGLEVERFGFVPVTRREIVDELHRMIGLRGGKTIGRKRLATEVTRRKEQGQTIVFTNGCFDLLHMGHVRYLWQARRMGNCLIVAINSDDSARRLKGPKRPVIGQLERAEMLGALECVDYVTVFDEDTPNKLLKLLSPDVLVKGGTTDVVVGREIVEAYGGKVLTVDTVEGLSTTEIIEKILDAHNKG